MADDATSKRKTYRREDGALMVEIRPGQFVNGELAVSLGLIKPRQLTPHCKTALQAASVENGRLPCHDRAAQPAYRRPIATADIQATAVLATAGSNSRNNVGVGLRGRPR